MATTTRNELVGILVRDFPAALKARIAKAADEQDTSMRALAADALATHYGYQWRANVRRGPGDTGQSTYLEIKVPRNVRIALNRDAAQKDIAARTIVLDVLGKAFPGK